MTAKTKFAKLNLFTLETRDVPALLYQVNLESPSRGELGESALAITNGGLHTTDEVTTNSTIEAVMRALGGSVQVGEHTNELTPETISTNPADQTPFLLIETETGNEVRLEDLAATPQQADWDYNDHAWFITDVERAEDQQGDDTNEFLKFIPEGHEHEITFTTHIPKFFNGQLLGILGSSIKSIALEFEQISGSKFLSISKYGFVEITDADTLDAQLSANPDDGVTVTFNVKDGQNILVSSFILGGKGKYNLLPQAYMYIKASDDTVYYPTNSQEFIDALKDLKNKGLTASEIIIKGHGGPDGIQLGEGDDFLTTGGKDIYAGDTEITGLFKDVTDGNTQITLRGCFTYDFAKSLEKNLDGARCYGAVRFVIGIPWTRIGLGIYR